MRRAVVVAIVLLAVVAAFALGQATSSDNVRPAKVETREKAPTDPWGEPEGYGQPDGYGKSAGW